MGLELQVSRVADQPLYLQIAQQIRSQIRDGRLPMGTKLPPIRQMAAELGVTRPTVESAYDELRADGWVETTVGRGTFVARMAEAHEMIDTLGLNLTANGVLADMPRIEEIPVICSLAYAEPDPSLFPMDEFWGAMNSLRHSGPELMRYGQPQGHPALRVELVNLVRERGIEAVPENVIVTSGATQGLALVLDALTQRGDVVAIEEPTHICLLHAIKARGLQPVGIPVDEDGMRVDILEQVLHHYGPRVLYTIPNFQNPTGVVLSDERREKLLKLARRHGLVVVEDDVYGMLSYDAPPKSALKAQDVDDLVVYVSSVSKVLMNGLRLGYVVAPRQLHDHLLRMKRAHDICTSPITQHVLLRLIRSGSYKTHLRRSLPVYAERRNALMQALATYMPEGTRWTHPTGGLSAWLTLPANVDGHVLYRDMLRKGFAFTPGNAFFANGSDAVHLRVCFGSQTPFVITEAIQVLATAIRKDMHTVPPPYVPPLV